jgi:hypothetical protein
MEIAIKTPAQYLEPESHFFCTAPSIGAVCTEKRLGIEVREFSRQRRGIGVDGANVEIHR